MHEAFRGCSFAGGRGAVRATGRGPGAPKALTPKAIRKQARYSRTRDDWSWKALLDPLIKSPCHGAEAHAGVGRLRWLGQGAATLRVRSAPVRSLGADPTPRKHYDQCIQDLLATLLHTSGGDCSELEEQVQDLSIASPLEFPFWSSCQCILANLTASFMMNLNGHQDHQFSTWDRQGD